MKKIVVKAYTQLNLGDDLFIKILCERYKNTKFYLWANEMYKNLKGIDSKNLKIEYADNFFKKAINKMGREFGFQNFLEYLSYRDMDAIVNIGGSIFMENSYSDIDYKVRERGIKKSKYFVLGANFGPYETKRYLERYREFFKKCEDVCFRDNYSKELFEENIKIRVAKDIVFSLGEKSDSGDYILISIIDPERKSKIKNENYFDTLKSFILEAIDSGENIKFISFCKDEGDEEAIVKIRNRIPNKYLSKISEYRYRGDLNEALEIIKKSSSIVATRFHAMILGLAYGKKVLPICYSEKMINVLKDIEFESKYMTMNNLKELNYKTLMEAQPLTEKEILKLKKEGELHFELLDKFLKVEIDG